MSATSLLNIGHSGLMASQKRLSTAGHNVANANTEGFSRQRAPQETAGPVQYGDLVLGTGTQIARVERVHDKYLESKLGSSVTDHSFFKEKAFQLSQVENVLNEIDIAGFNSTLNSFFNSFRELSKRPDNESLKIIVREKSIHLVKNFHRIKRSLNDLQLSIDRKIVGSVENINLVLRQIGKLNGEIAKVENEERVTGDLRDGRDLKIRELAEFLSINVYEDNRGQYTINANGIGSLVSGSNVQELSGQKSNDSNSYLPGGVEIYFTERSAYAVSKKLSGGSLGALFSIRDGELKELQKHLDNLAFSLVNEINSAHRHGVVIRGLGSGINEKRITGVNFFNELGSDYRAGESIDISKEIRQDSRNIATAEYPGTPGDNRVAVLISRLQYDKVLDDRSSTFEDFYLKGIGKIGARLKEVKMNEEHSFGILTQDKEIRERVSGVSIDEETANMMRFQHAFNASARVMSVADEMFKTVLGIKKL